MGKKSRGKKRAKKKAQPTSVTSSQHPSKSNSPSRGATKEPSKGRVVITHSTYLPGLIPLLEKLANYPAIQTITPAVSSRVMSNAPQFRLKVSVPITGGHKLIARHRKSAQEVFVITSWSKAELEQAIAHILS